VSVVGLHFRADISDSYRDSVVQASSEQRMTDELAGQTVADRTVAAAAFATNRPVASRPSGALKSPKDWEYHQRSEVIKKLTTRSTA